METEFRSELNIITFSRLKPGDFFVFNRTDIKTRTVQLCTNHDKLNSVSLGTGHLYNTLPSTTIIKVKPINLNFACEGYVTYRGDNGWAVTNIPNFTFYGFLKPGDVFLNFKQSNRDESVPFLKVDPIKDIKYVSFNGECVDGLWNSVKIKLELFEKPVFVPCEE